LQRKGDGIHGIFILGYTTSGIRKPSGGKPLSGAKHDQLMEQRPTYRAVSALDTTLGMRMTHIELLGIDLKSDVLNDLFETYDVDVVYRYDRTGENLPDEYSADIPELGLEFMFDSEQKLRTLFMKDVASDGFNPFEEDETSLPKISSKAAAIRYASANEIQITQGTTDLLGEVRDWVRFVYANYSVHYEFVESKLSMTTIQGAHA
jgi:hypothetical protein